MWIAPIAKCKLQNGNCKFVARAREHSSGSQTLIGNQNRLLLRLFLQLLALLLRGSADVRTARRWPPAIRSARLPDDPVLALREVCRVLRPGGVVGTVTWAEDPEIEASRVWEAELDSHGARDPVAPRPRRDEPLNTPEKMVGLFCATRFEPMKVWVERFEHHWELDELSRMHLTFGRTKRGCHMCADSQLRK